MSIPLNRRHFMEATVASSAVAIVPRHVLGGAGHVAPSDKVTLAHIGMGTQSIRELGGLLKDPNIQIVAVCDPNTDSEDYVEWGKGGILKQIQSLLGDSSWRAKSTGCPGGREVGREVIDGYYAKQRGAEGFKACSTYADFRELLDKEKDVDAVKIMTPDHLHAYIAVAAMKKGKHVMTHKPIANRLAEGRLAIQTARETKVTTHLLAYGSGTGNALIAETIKTGVIGRLKEIHNWTNRPVWPQYTAIPTDTPPVPKGFDWDLWLGPALQRPYHPHYTHTVFRGWYDFGGGSMADMGIYSLWPVFVALNLGVPESAQAWATHTCRIENGVSRPVKNDFSYPTGCSLRFKFGASDHQPGIELFWYDGGMKPRLPEEVESHGVEMQREGILFVGEHGSIMGSFHGQNPRLFQNGKNEPLQIVVPPKLSVRHVPWIEAVRNGGQSPGSFLNAAAITDTVNLGTVALRTGQKVLFDSKNMKVTNVARANQYLSREYRSGWEM